MKPIRSRLRIVSRRSLSRPRSVSPRLTVPDVGRSSPAATFRNVLLPEPDGPMIAVNDPGGISMLIPSSATTAPSPSPWTLRTSRSAIAGAATAAAALVAEFMAGRLLDSPRASHPASRRPVFRALGAGGVASRTSCGPPGARLQSACRMIRFTLMGSRAAGADGPPGRTRARAGAESPDRSRAQRLVLARAVGGRGRRELRRPDPGSLPRGRAGPGLRDHPHALRRVVRGVRPDRLAPAPRQRGRPPPHRRGLRRPHRPDPDAARVAGGPHARGTGRGAVDHRVRHADPELRDRRPAGDDGRPRPRVDVLRRPVRAAVRGAAVPRPARQRAARVARRRGRERAWTRSGWSS